MPNSQYVSLIKSFLALNAPGQPALTEEPGALQFTVGELTCTVFSLEGSDLLVMQCEVMALADLGPERSPPALRLLHGLNWASAIRSGIVTLVDDRDRVLVSQTSDIRQMNAHQLAEQMAVLLESAASLGSTLRAMPMPQKPQGRPSMPLHHGSFA